MKHVYLLLIALFFSLASYAVGPIVGPTSMCVGDNATYTNSTVGGTWSSSITAVGTIASFSGAFSSLGAGVTTITYSDGSSMAVLSVTVHPLPQPITGPVEVCAGATITLSDVTAGGTWSAPAFTSIATVGSFTGAVTGVGAGVATISYTTAAGCRATYVITVNPVPSSISGMATVCAGGTSSLFGLPSGGTWSTASATATIGSTTGVVTGLSVGTAIITYTNAKGCYITRTISVDPCPTLSSVGVDNEERVTVYPNPATDELVVGTTGVYNSLTISNNLGQVLLLQPAGTSLIKADVSKLPPGLYFVTLRGEQGNVVRRFAKL